VKVAAAAPSFRAMDRKRPFASLLDPFAPAVAAEAFGMAFTEKEPSRKRRVKLVPTRSP